MRKKIKSHLASTCTQLASFFILSQLLFDLSSAASTSKCENVIAFVVVSSPTTLTFNLIKRPQPKRNFERDKTNRLIRRSCASIIASRLTCAAKLMSALHKLCTCCCLPVAPLFGYLTSSHTCKSLLLAQLAHSINSRAARACV